MSQHQQDPHVAIYYNSEIMTGHKPPARGMAAEEPARIVGIEAILKGHQDIREAVRIWEETGGREVPLLGDGGIWSSCRIVKVDEEAALTDAAVAAEYGEKMVRHALANTPARGSRTDAGCSDVYWSKGSWLAAKTAAAAAVAATEAALAVATATATATATQTPQHAFCIVRPPGHHCFDMPAGFCILNNVVIAARKVLAAGKRVAIVDWDYHFGDGTAAALWGEEHAMFVSLHAARTRDGYPTYPRPTARNFKGNGLRRATEGRCFNIQWDTDDADDAALAYAFQHAILPALARFAPDVILVSAGYDALKGDDLAGMELTPAAFGFAAAALTRLQKPIVAVLEGGYNVELLAHGVAHTILGLQQNPTIMADLDAWLAQQPATEHATAVQEVAEAVLVTKPADAS